LLLFIANLQEHSLSVIMNILIKYDISFTCKAILQEQLEKIAVDFSIIGLNEIEFKKPLSSSQTERLKLLLQNYGIEVIENQKVALVQKIKDTIVDMVWNDDILPNVATSAYLADALNHSYGYLSNLFSEITYSTIENYIIFQKIERVKQMTISENYTLTEISYKLNYSSVAHLSNQFKKTTGLTPSAFQRIVKKKRENRAAVIN
jgi:AraC-like DNA-binding protein